jgi:hypothetical protein
LSVDPLLLLLGKYAFHSGRGDRTSRVNDGTLPHPSVTSLYTLRVASYDGLGNQDEDLHPSIDRLLLIPLPYIYFAIQYTHSDCR